MKTIDIPLKSMGMLKIILIANNLSPFKQSMYFALKLYLTA